MNALLVELHKQKHDPAIFIFAETNDKNWLDGAIIKQFNSVEITPMTDAHRKIYIEDRLKNFVIANKQNAIHIVSKETKGLSRRKIQMALNSAFFLSIRTQRKDNDVDEYSQIPEPTIVSIKDLVTCIRQEQTSRAVPYSITIDRFVRDSQPYLACIDVCIIFGKIVLGLYNLSQNK
ncbi:MAG: hypothetical protein WC707_06335 [Candidatus Babeliaceae bacterium]|jgi:SpoVK/Ycf46/Vps4 family AAA+-type ATPase